jgi:hypothetical protein
MGIKMANGSKDSDLSGDENLNDSGKDSWTINKTCLQPNMAAFVKKKKKKK